MKVLFIESDQMAEYNCSMWRCVVPSRGLNKAGVKSAVVRIEDWVARTPEVMELCEDCDIMFVQRNIFGNVLENILYWKHKGKVVVIDLDDSYENMTENTGSPSYEFWANARQEGKDDKGNKAWQILDPKPMEQLQWGVGLAENVSSPSKLICEDWKDYAKTYWFPNYIDGNVYKKVDAYKPPNKIFLGWGGSMTHVASWKQSGCAQAVKKIMVEFPNVDVLLMGDPRIGKAIDMPPARKSAIGWIPPAAFKDKLLVADIGLAPLFGEYDRRRSWIKFLEFTILGIPWIGTNLEPNRDIQTMTGRLVENTPEDWYGALRYAITNLTELKAEALENIPVGQAFSIENNTGTLISLFERIIKDNK